MNISKFTQKSLQAVQDLEKTAYDFGNQEIEQEQMFSTPPVCGELLWRTLKKIIRTLR